MRMFVGLYILMLMTSCRLFLDKIPVNNLTSKNIFDRNMFASCASMLIELTVLSSWPFIQIWFLWTTSPAKRYCHVVIKSHTWNYFLLCAAPRLGGLQHFLYYGTFSRGNSAVLLDFVQMRGRGRALPNFFSIQKNSSFFWETFPNNDYYDNNFVQSESGQKYSCGDRGRPLLVGTKADCGSCKLPWGFRQVDKASIYLFVFCICICIYQMFTF